MNKFNDFYELLTTFLASLQVMDQLNIELVIVQIAGVDSLVIKGKNQVDGGVVLGVNDYTFTQRECDMLLKVLSADILAGLSAHNCFIDKAYCYASAFDKKSLGLIGYQFRVYRNGEYSLYWNLSLKRFAHLTL